MALKHLKNAIELLHAGMSITDIATIVGMKDEPDQSGQTETESSGQDTETNTAEQDTETETGGQVTETESAGQETVTPEQDKPDETSAPKKNPYQEKATNVLSQDSLVTELNKIF